MTLHCILSRPVTGDRVMKEMQLASPQWELLNWSWSQTLRSVGCERAPTERPVAPADVSVGPLEEAAGDTAAGVMYCVTLLPSVAAIDRGSRSNTPAVKTSSIFPQYCGRWPAGCLYGPVHRTSHVKYSNIALNGLYVWLGVCVCGSVCVCVHACDVCLCTDIFELLPIWSTYAVTRAGSRV